MGDEQRDNTLIFMPRDGSRTILLVGTNHEAEVFEISQPMSNDHLFDLITRFMEARNGYARFGEARHEVLKYCTYVELNDSIIRSMLIDVVFQMFEVSIQNV